MQLLCALGNARNDADLGAAVLGGVLGDALGRRVLIPRADHLVLGGKVDPQLEAVKFPTVLENLLGGHLAMHNAGPGGHPLAPSGAKLAAIALRIKMLNGALLDVRDGLEPTVRVVGRPNGLPRAVVHRAHLIEHQEGPNGGQLENTNRKGRIGIRKRKWCKKKKWCNAQK